MCYTLMREGVTRVTPTKPFEVGKRVFAALQPQSRHSSRPSALQPPFGTPAALTLTLTRPQANPNPNPNPIAEGSEQVRRRTRELIAEVRHRLGAPFKKIWTDGKITDQ